ncbi:hypothetical protein UFOVP235_27 [uncultured Caudovirales phage]|uniref:Uncharacterized protein n=1 Tax=uncultured Caudovirales phage TaxID=2100421 RepID=A0A6J7WQE7_9CAUD|nr:hypothetical protein UFOVP235_27 [uncultured Caudovirales phage]
MRLRQVFPQNYKTSEQINTEFESVIRYLNSAELGNKTISELMAQIFDSNGVWSGPVAFRFSAIDGLQYRIGIYSDPDLGWVSIAATADLRGEPGEYLGSVPAPLFSQRYDYTVASSVKTFNYDFTTSDDLLVYKNGVLLKPTTDYTATATSGATVGSVSVPGSTNGDKLTAIRIRKQFTDQYRRSDTLTTGYQSNFGFDYDTTLDEIQVYKNGVLQRFGGSYDYVLDDTNNIITFNASVASGNNVTIVAVRRAETTNVTGLMLEGNFTDASTGKIPWAKIGVNAAEINSDRVNGLSALITSAARITVSASQPSSPAAGNLWLDTSTTPNRLKFYSGTAWLQTAPETLLSTPSSSDAGKAVYVDALGQSLIYKTIDLSSVIAVTQKGAASGVASLDAAGRLPSTQLPEVIGKSTIYWKISGALTNSTNYIAARIFLQKFKIVGIAMRLSTGTATGEFTVNGVSQITGQSLSVNPVESTLGSPITIDASSSSVSLGVKVTNVSSAADLEISIAIQELAS